MNDNAAPQAAWPDEALLPPSTVPEELVYEFPGIRMRAWTKPYSAGARRYAAVHWHDDFEFLLVRSGHMFIYVNGEKIRLETGDVVFVNSGQIHIWYSDVIAGCSYACAILHPALLGCEPGLRDKVVKPVMRNTGIPFAVFRGEAAEPLGSLIVEAAQNAASSGCGAAAKAVGAAMQLWGAFLEKVADADEGELDRGATRDASDAEIEAARTMVSFIYAHYPEKLTVSRIAAAAAVSRSSCCRIFAEQLRTSPIAFLNEYRMKRAMGMLRHSQASIADIAFGCGFAHQSYFTKLFRAAHGTTPRQWRRKNGAARKPRS
jgi:AraC-like DNA-binding protein